MEDSLEATRNDSTLLIEAFSSILKDLVLLTKAKGLREKSISSIIQMPSSTLKISLMGVMSSLLSIRSLKILRVMLELSTCVSPILGSAVNLHISLTCISPLQADHRDVTRMMKTTDDGPTFFGSFLIKPTYVTAYVGFLFYSAYVFNQRVFNHCNVDWNRKITSRTLGFVIYTFILVTAAHLLIWN